MGPGCGTSEEMQNFCLSSLAVRQTGFLHFGLQFQWFPLMLTSPINPCQAGGHGSIADHSFNLSSCTLFANWLF